MNVPDPSRIALLPWRSMDTFPRDGSINAVMFYPWKVRTNGPHIQFGQWMDLYGTGGKLCSPWDCDNEPYADAWLPLAELASLSLPASGTLTEGGDVQQAPSDSLSGPTGNAGDAQ